MRREVTRPYTLRPPDLFLVSVRARIGRFLERPTGLFSEVKRWDGVSGRKCLMGMAGVLVAVVASDELDLVARLERHDGLLVVRGRARRSLAALLVLAAVVHRVHAAHRDLERGLDGLGDGVLVRALRDLEGVLAELGGLLVGLLREEHALEDLVGVHQFLSPATRAMMVSSAFVLTMIFPYWERSSVLSFAASWRDTRPMLRAAWRVSAANGASTRRIFPLGAMSPTTLFTTFVFLTVWLKSSITAISPADTRSNRARLKASALTFPFIFL